jgi:nitroreductase
MDQIENIIKSRRSVYPKYYIDKEISEETILWLLDLANWAPTHKKTEPWRFKVFHSKESRKQLGEYLASAFKESALSKGGAFPELKFQKTLKKPLQSGCVIAVCMQRDPLERLPEWEEIAAVSCAVQNMWLAASTKGLGAYWSTPSSIIEAREFLQLKENEKCLGLFYIGYRNELEFGSSRGPIEDKISFM